MISKTALFGTALAVLAGGGLLTACGDSTPTGSNEPAPPATKEPVKPLLQKKEIADWCPEHGVPESICTRCTVTARATLSMRSRTVSTCEKNTHTASGTQH